MIHRRIFPTHHRYTNYGVNISYLKFSAIHPTTEGHGFSGETLYDTNIFNILMSRKLRIVDLDEEHINTIRRVITEIGGPVIPLTLVFEGLGYTGVTGLEWGIITGIISAVAVELGYRIQKISRSIILVKEHQGEKK